MATRTRTTVEEAIAYFDRAMQTERPQPPTGFFTVRQWAEMKRIPLPTMKEQIRKLVDAGKTEKWVGQNVNPRAAGRATYYKIVETPSMSPSEKPSGIFEAYTRQQCMCGKAAPKGCVYCPDCQP